MTIRWTPILMLALLAGCAAPYKIDRDYDPEVIFTQYRTWAWISENPMITSGAVGAAASENPLLESRIMRLVEQAMATKGFRRVDDPEAADMALSFTIGARDKIRVDSYPVSYHRAYGGWGRGWGYGYGHAYPAREVDVREYTEGQLAIDVFDVSERKPIYHGFATGNVRKNRDREEREALLREVVKAIMDTFPPA